ncbi:hypothetical protein QYS49_26250 [Marivirga salinae]|uniref:Uncharacterized protein n=1 Tax=Marivirga salinarum TaxID=3059078 RepID=A0AA49JBC4_9BACT|nr:hypothetical protein [Marivirga sp. BDSF4-3]WKK75093.2 hypothetical protein QYS49_26250 [Marivirga sp. BDSF4-3]
MKNLILGISLIIIILSISACEKKESYYALTTFELDSADVNKGPIVLNAVSIGSSPESQSTAFRAQNGLRGVEGDREYDLSIAHLDDSFRGEGEYSKEDNIGIRFVHHDEYDEHPTNLSYAYTVIDSLWLKYTTVNKDIIKGEFFIKVSSEQDPSVTYTLSDGAFEFSNYEDKFY